MCANDWTAARVMHAVLELGYQVPGDVRLVGIDDVEYAALLPVPLTTLRQPTRQIGAAAMAAMGSPRVLAKSLRRNLAHRSVDDHLAAVDVVRLARDPGPGLAGQEDHHVGDVDAGAGPAERDVAADEVVPRLATGDVVHG